MRMPPLTLLRHLPWLALLPLQALAAQVEIAGLAPDRRPVSAPTITSAPVSNELKAHRLFGVVPPWPGNVERIAEQGNWYSPFFRPGMTGPYDLRGWHLPHGNQ